MLVAERYRLQASIGRGGMGEVWQATDEVLGRAVAVKLLLGDEADSAASARFRLEAQTAARLSHPYVVAVFDFGAWDDRFYLVMELVEGRSLAQELTASGTLGADRVATIAAQAAAGLAAAHREGIVHRDIKPGNLLVDAQGTVKIGDFGIARFVDDPSSALTTAGQIVGTSLYLAPERALGRPASAASDVYSLGCVLYQLLTGRPPFQGESATITLHQHIDMAPVPPRERGSQLPPAFENYLLGLLAKQPEDRPTAQEVADWFGTGAWQGRAEPLPVAAQQPRTQVSYATAPPRQQPGGADSGAPTTYRLPATAAQPNGRSAHGGRSAHAARSGPLPAPAPSSHASHSARSGPSRRARPSGGGGGRGGVGTAVRRRPRVFGILAGAVIFVLAVLAGMSMFSPDDTTPEGGSKDAPPSAGATENSSGRSATGAPVAGTVDQGQDQNRGRERGGEQGQEAGTAPDVDPAPTASPSVTKEIPEGGPDPAAGDAEKPRKPGRGGEELPDGADDEDDTDDGEE
ncbi:protein kinase [Streptomyces sp. A15ISP2-DRY2]|uniref:non-specific serine/threonine protein kinase n=2 Tax=Streptomyces ortus TaxID=2867268 RepID=A0ABT3VBD4_9ACTN|nr:serine/threonine-protein kinase [Streptomyces ortus]MCX4235633.1 protein kinase [Streptomyces ortus]